MRRTIPHTFLIPTILIIVLLLAGAGTLSARPDPRIDARVLANIEAEGASDTLILLSEQSDLSPAYELNSKEARGRWIYDTLRAVAQRSQTDLVAELDRSAVPYQRFWAVNAVKARLDAETLQRVLALPAVAAVRADMPVKGIDPLPADELEAAAVTGTTWGVERVQAPWAWQQGYTGEGIVLAGQDTGYEWDHPALINAYRGLDPETGFIDHNYNWHDAITAPIGSGSSSCGYGSLIPCDDHFHGTHTAGTMIGNDLDPDDPAWPAGATNAIGVAPGAQWIGCRNMDRGVGRPSTYIECFEWLIAPYHFAGNPLTDGDPSKAPDVISNSWACPLPSSPNATECQADEISSIEPVVNAADAAGIVVVVSAGNYGPSCESILDPPAIYPRSFAVGNTTSTDALSGSSSRGPVTYLGQTYIKPDVAAPGSSVLSAGLDGSYRTASGTSMAAPHVAGVIALLLDAEPGLRGNTDLIKAIVSRTTDPITDFTCGGDDSGTPNNRFGHGIVNARRAIESLSQPGFLTGNVTDAGSGGVLKGATIRILDDEGSLVAKTITDSFGNFSLSVGWGAYRVEARRVPYAIENTSPVIVVGGQTTSTDFALETIDLFLPLLQRTVK